VKPGGFRRSSANIVSMNDSQPLTEATEIYRKLEERAISDSNDLNRRIVSCKACRRGQGYLPVVGSGHPLADILLVKYQPHYLEVNEGVSFYGRSGSAILKSMERLGVNPLVVYGTNIIKCHDVRPAEGERKCPLYWLEEFHITHPRIMVVMGKQTLQIINKARVAGMKRLSWDPGALQTFTPFCKALVTPDIDVSLDDDQAKAEFWKALRSLGEWFADEPPY
jgi:uracil-DNA glycosylase family 4